MRPRRRWPPSCDQGDDQGVRELRWPLVGISVAVGVLVDAIVKIELSAVLNRARLPAASKIDPSTRGCAADAPWGLLSTLPSLDIYRLSPHLRHAFRPRNESWRPSAPRQTSRRRGWSKAAGTRCTAASMEYNWADPKKNTKLSSLLMCVALAGMWRSYTRVD